MGGLEAGLGSGDTAVAGNETRYGVVVPPQWQPRCVGRRPAAVIPSGFRGCAARGTWGVARTGQRDQSETRPRRLQQGDLGSQLTDQLAQQGGFPASRCRNALPGVILD
jgi:hypothetical protein